MLNTSRPVGTSTRKCVCVLGLLLAGAFFWQNLPLEWRKSALTPVPTANLNSPLRDAPEILIRLPLSVIVQLLLDLRT